MDLKSKFYTIFKTLNPSNYSELSEQPFSVVLKYYFFIVIFGVLVMSLLFIPTLYSMNRYFSEDLAHFQTLNVTTSFDVKESFNLLSDPVIRFEQVPRNLTNELFLITSQDVSYKKYLFFGTVISHPLSSGVDVAGSSAAKNLIVLGIFFMIPSLIFWCAVLFLVYFAIIILLMYIVSLVIVALARVNINLFTLLKLCIFASTIMIFVQLFSMPFVRVFWFAILLYFALVLFVLLLFNADAKHNRGNISSMDSSSRGSKSKNIFSKDSSSDNGFSSKSKVEVKESYDVDEHGNMKGQKRKRSFDEENDGYVELK